MQTGDRVYFHHTDKTGVEKKFPAIILEEKAERFKIRLGRLNLHSRKTELCEHETGSESLTTRETPCSFEHELVSGEVD